MPAPKRGPSRKRCSAASGPVGLMASPLSLISLSLSLSVSVSVCVCVCVCAPSLGCATHFRFQVTGVPLGDLGRHG